MNRIDPPRFITVEGGEGAGKSTLIKRIEEFLSSEGWHVVSTREPGGSRFGNRIRDWLLSKEEGVRIGTKAELLLFLAARAQHIEEVIAPAISAGHVVVCDRFNDSTIAYQGAGRGLGAPYVSNLCASVCGTSVPGLTFYLDIDPKIGLQRTERLHKEHAAAGEVDRIEGESLDFHCRIRDTFQELARKEQGRFQVIDASQSCEEVWKECKKILVARFSYV